MRWLGGVPFIHSFIHSFIALVKIGRSVGEARVACAWRVGVDIVVEVWRFVVFYATRARVVWR